MSLFNELKRRNVFKVGLAYIVVGWLVAQVLQLIFESFGTPNWVMKTVLVLLATGLPFALFFSWVFEMTPDGIKRESELDRSQSIVPKTGEKLNRTIMALLVLSLVYFVWESRFQAESTTSRKAKNSALTATQPEAVNLQESADIDESEKPDTTPSRENSIAVLPFTNRSANPDDAYFTDGIHDDLLTQLAKTKAFSVISQTSVLEYRETEKNLKQIAKELGVANVMEGSVQRSGNRVRINVQLIDAATDKHLWAEIYDRQLTTENLFDIQSEIAQAIATALHATLTPSEIANVADVPTKNIEAYELYLQGKRILLSELEVSYETSLELNQAALKLDPNFKLAWIGLAKAYIVLYWSYGGDPENRQLARDAIDKAKSIDADFPELYMAEGFYHYWGLLDYPVALKYFEKALELMPGNSEAYMLKGWASRRAGLWDQAVISMQQAIKLNPRIVYNLAELGQTLGQTGRIEEAIAITKQAHNLDPDDYWAKTYLANLMLQVGDIKHANFLAIGVQHSTEPDFLESYWNVKVLAGEYENALKFAQTWNSEWEVHRQKIVLKQQLVAEMLMIMGREGEAGKQALIALDRLKLMEKQNPSDYRIIEAKLRSYAVGGEQQKVTRLASQYLVVKPADAVEEIYQNIRLSRSYALAGMVKECVDTLERLLSGYSTISVAWLDLDPYYNGVREAPEFIALLERHR